MDHTSRRRVLEAAAAGTALSLAGCSALDDDETIEEEPDVESDGDGSGAPELEGEAAATIAVDIESRMAEIEAEIDERIEEGEIDQEEAQAEFQEAQIEALEEATAAVESHAEGIDGLRVVESSVQAGAMLVDGDAAAILDTLDSEDVAALVSAEQFEAFQ